MRTFSSIATSLLIVLIGLSCAYYNIFWTAEREYQKAVSTSNIEEFWNPYAMNKLTPDGARLIDSCIKRCSKLLVLYPSSKWADDALLMLGNCFVLKGDYEKALKKYEELLALSKDAPLVEEAKYMTAFTLALMGHGDDAKAELEKLSHTRSNLIRQKAFFLKGIIGFETGDIDKAIIDLTTYVNEFPNGSRVREANLYLGRALLKADRPQEAKAVLSKIANPGDALGSIASILISRAYLADGDADFATQVLEDVSLRAPADTTKARAMLLLSSVFVNRSDYQRAISVLVRADSLIGAKGGTIKCEILYELGNVHEAHLSDFGKATEFYEKVPKDNSRCSLMARKRASALKALRQYESKLSDSTQASPDVRASTLFRIGEIYYEDLGLSDRAVKFYQEVVDSFPDNEFAARSLLQLADIAESRKDTIATTYYRLIVERFPQTVFANVARWKLNLPLIDIPFPVGEGEKGVGESGSSGSASGRKASESQTVRPPSVTVGPIDTAWADTLMEMRRTPMEEYMHRREPQLEESTFLHIPRPEENRGQQQEDYWEDQ